MAPIDPRYVTEAVHAHADEWENAGVRWRLTVGSGLDESIASLTCETDQTVIHFTVVTDGDAEMKVTRRSVRLSSRYYYRLATAEDVATCLAELTRQMIDV